MHRPLEDCPVCSGTLHISELACSACGTRIAGAFWNSALATLDVEGTAFLLGFLRHRGDLHDLALERGIPLAEAARHLDSLLLALGIQEHAPVPEATPPDRPHFRRSEILEQLDRGEITADEATRRLRDMQ